MAALLAGCATASPPPAPLVDAGPGQRAWAAACEGSDEWDKPGPPFRVYGNTYYVGTCGIAVLLIADPKGHVVIDSGTAKGAEIVLTNIRALGFDPRDVATLLMSHEHFDHVGGMARLQNATGARIVTTGEAAKVLRTGRTSPDDPQAGSGHPPFAAVGGPIIEIGDEQPLREGRLSFTPMMTPGHTLGAMSWRWTSCEGRDCRSIVYADSLNPVSAEGYGYSEHPALVANFRAGIAKVAAAPCDIVLTPHPGAPLRDRLMGTKPLVDPAGCRDYAASRSDRLDKRLAAEATAEKTGG